MKKHQSILAIVALSVGLAIVSLNSFASGDADQYLAMEHYQTMEHHHHHAMVGNGYTRSVVSYQTPDVKLMDTHGKKVALNDSLDVDQPVMLNFIFTTCTTICPVMSATFSQVQEKLGPNAGTVRMVSISIDPEHDSPAKLNEYAKRFEAGPQWSMLTGSVEDSIAVQRAFNVYRGDKMNHEPVTFLRKGADKPWVRIDGFASADELLREYHGLVPD
ncbi:photosynthetic protein synthase I [Ferrigenium kumadai]|uniref:Photosynthetic protein synthase I n=1 Tax=Ferrigenium kumadai TaxID=1682490 RepID=A0AAN1SZ15_9PROT|nr:SCO family protein [Ferrigenium kumadai]BBI99718.1 photosynthetic protein synthase I [Ferrigenium kumadai]